MSFYVRKSIKAGPFRVNVSRSGIGVSTSIPGFKVGTGPRCNYVRVARNGVSYRTSVGGQSTRRRLRQQPARATASRLPLPNVDVVLEDLTGASLLDLVDTEPSDLLGQINKAATRHRTWPWIVIPGLLIALSSLASNPIGGGEWLLIVLLLGGWRFERDQIRRSVVLFYDVDADAASGYQALVDAFEGITGCAAAWTIATQRAVETTHRHKLNGGAKSIVSRQPAQCSLNGPRVLKTNIEVSSFEAGSRGIYFLPDRILIRDRRQFADLSYAHCQVASESTNFIESARPPSDGEVVGSTWKYVNVKGGPDRRYKDNPKLPILRYGELTLSSDSGLHSVWQFSRPGPVALLASSLTRMRTPVAVPRPVENVPVAARESIVLPAPKPLSSQASTPPPPQAASRWLPSGEAVEVAGRTIAGGTFYFGTLGVSASNRAGEPSLVDPSLPVGWERPDWSGESVGYWPTYAGLNPGARAAYLGWLARGRSVPDAYIGYVFLYFYGIERRVLVDAKLNPGHGDVEACAQEVRRLLDIYGDNSSFSSYASSFLDLIDAMTATAKQSDAPVWSDLRRTWEVPLSVRVGLGRFVSQGRPIPAVWALVFLRTHPEAYLRTPATRCGAEFDALFVTRYEAKYGNGMLVRAPKALIEVRYHAASPGLRGEYDRHLDLPDISKIDGPINKLRELAADCTDDLDAYSRYLGRNPDGADLPVAIGLLPGELFRTHGGPAFDALRSWLEELVVAGPTALPLDDLVTRWSPGRDAKLTKSDAIALAGFLSNLGIGVESDVRFGGALPQPGSTVVVFALANGSSSAPSSEYAAASLLVDLTAVVSSADGIVSDKERRHLAGYLASALGLSEAERTRLDARHLWHAEAKPSLTGVKRRIEVMETARRVEIGRFLVGIAAADGGVSPEEITVLVKLFKLLGLDEGDVYRTVHGIGSDSGPVTVETGSEAAPRWKIPSAPATDRMDLDPEKIRTRLAETAAVSALLADIFVDDESPDPSRPLGESESTMAVRSSVPAFAGLDVAHDTLATGLLVKESWSRSEVEQLAATLGLPLLDGAIDRINEAVIDACGEPLIEGDDPLELNPDAVMELS